jgi:hypothetical protein
MVTNKRLPIKIPDYCACGAATYKGIGKGAVAQESSQTPIPRHPANE